MLAKTTHTRIGKSTLGRLCRFGILVCGIVTSFPICVAAAPPSCDYNFELQPRSAEELPRHLQYAVVQIRNASGHGLGTGYVIDLAHGYIITARHVVADFMADPDPLRVTATHLPSLQSIPATVVDDLGDSGVDLALLKADGRALRDAGFTALDLQMRMPVESERVGILGYPENESNRLNAHVGQVSYIDRFDMTYRSARDGAEKTEPRAEIVVAHDVWAGHSGSPLISKHDVVIGTAKSRDGSREAHYIPTSYVFDFIVGIAEGGMTDSARRIFDLMASPDASVHELASVFQSTLTNLELMTWAIQAARKPDLAGRVEQFLTCPLQKVYSDRKIERAYHFIAAVVPGGQDLTPDLLRIRPR